MGIFKSKPVAPKMSGRKVILRQLIAGHPTAAAQTFVAMTPLVSDFSLRALINAVLVGKPEDIATAARYYATTACQGDPDAYALCMQLAGVSAPVSK